MTMARLRVVHKDGLTHVFDAETGKEIENCMKLTFVHDPCGEGVRLELTIVDWSPALEIETSGGVKTVDATTLKDVARRHREIKFREFT
jgi:hypothetical protein